MDVSLADLLEIEALSDSQIIAGSSGVSRNVESCVLLDYEFLPELRGRYINSNFHKGQLALSSLSFARDNIYLVSDAVKHLIEVEAAGLVVSNVLNLPLHDAALRYANAKGFPILSAPVPCDFCAIVRDVAASIAELQRADFGDAAIGQILYVAHTPGEIRAAALRLNPSFREGLRVLYLQKKETLGTEEYRQIVSGYRASSIHDTHNSLYRYRDGLVLVLTGEQADDYSEEAADAHLDALALGPAYTIGISDAHFGLAEVKPALEEALLAARGALRMGRDRASYHELGSYQAIAPLADHPAMYEYARRLLEPLVRHDAETNGSLLETLTGYVLADGDLHALALTLGQHENTIRYRFTQIERVTGLNPIKSAGYEQLALAIKINQYAS